MHIVLLFFVFLFQGGLGDLIVQLQNGKVEGTTFGTPSGRTFYTWRGIPYAQPPLGNRRYLPPLKAEPWTDILDASKDSPACLQFFSVYAGDLVPPNDESEDCLYINVYSPVPVGSNSSINATLPILFWIYGGGFAIGTGDFAYYDPTPFLEENVIVVTFNYRLSTFGFLSTEDEVILGNAGLKDQLLALQWTKDNIASFGGSPNDITIFGESAGAASVGYHLTSPKSRNLFKGAILESGSSLATVLHPNPREFAITLANQINASITNTSSSVEVLNVLQAAPAELLVNLSGSGGKQCFPCFHGPHAPSELIHPHFFTRTMAPVLEVESELSFLTTTLYEAAEAGNFARVPIIVGYNSEESLVPITDLATVLQEAIQHDLHPELLVPSMSLKENLSTTVIGEEVRQQYIGQDKLFSENLAAYLAWKSTGITRASPRYAVFHSKFAPVYMYQFSYYGTLSKNNLIVQGAGKVGHEQEVGYLFNMSTRPIKTELDYLTRRRLVKLWTNFAKTSNPTPDDDSAELLQNVKWEPITEDNLHYIDIDENLEFKPSGKIHDFLIFWEHIWETYGQRPYNTF